MSGINLDKLRRSKVIVKLQGREYVTFSGLLWTAHDNGLTSINTEIISWEPDARAAVVRAVVEGARGRFTAHGDANPDNVGRNIVGACLRMAETRATARALRCYLGIGATALSELPGEQPALTTEPPAALVAAVGDLSINLDDVLRYCVSQGWGDPSTWKGSAVDQFVVDLRAGKIAALHGGS